jgi:CSLREA domain-containing protein
VCCAFGPIIFMKTKAFISFFLQPLVSIKMRGVFCALAVLAGAIGDAHAQFNLVSNGDFKANASSFGAWPGYTGGANPATITSWTSLYAGIGVGVNGAGVSFTPTNPFAPVNDGGNTYAFIQSGAGALAQNLSLAAGRTYKMEFDAAGRAGNTTTFRVLIRDNSQVYVTSGDLVANTAGFIHFVYTFTAPNTFDGTPSIQLYNLTAGDNTVDFANVSVSRNILDFDDVASGTKINTYYAGVTFTNPLGGNVFAKSGLGFAPSPTNVICITNGGPIFPFFDAPLGAVDATFTTHMRTVSIDVRPVSQVADHTDPTAARPYLQAFDASGNLLNTVYYAGTLPQGCCNEVGAIETLTITSPSANIARVRFTSQQPVSGVHTYGLFDNLRYDDGYYYLTVNIVGGGYVFISPFGPYFYGSFPSLTASPFIDRAFAGWSGDFTDTNASIYPLMFSDKTITATFVPAPQPGPNYVVTTTDDHDDGIAGVYDCTLREAINAANANPDANTITFAANVTNYIALKLGELYIIENVTIIGPGAKTLAIIVTNTSSAFDVGGGAATISGLNIRNVVVGFNSYRGINIVANSSLTLNACNLSGFRDTGIFNGGTLSLNSCTVTSNGGDNGGGVGNYGSLTITNTTISGNSATSGGGIYNHPTGTLTLISSTMYSNNIINFSVGGGGIRNNSGVAMIRNSIIAGNTNAGAAIGPDCVGSFTSLGYNLIGKTNDSTGFTSASQDQVGSIASPINPLLGPLADNGGPTLTHRLLSGSTALDKGNSFGLNTDQRGRPRPYDVSSVANASGGDGSDIGAYELNLPVLSIARLSNNVVLSWSTNDPGFTLESSAQLTPTAWAAVPGTPPILGSQYTVTTNTAAGKQFYRLSSP